MVRSSQCVLAAEAVHQGSRCQKVQNTHIPLDSWQLRRNSHDYFSSSEASQFAACVSIISSRHHFHLPVNSPVMNRELELSTLRNICQANGWASVRVMVIMWNDEECACRGQSFSSFRTSHSEPTCLFRASFIALPKTVGVDWLIEKKIFDSKIKCGGYYLSHTQIQSFKEN